MLICKGTFRKYKIENMTSDGYFSIMYTNIHCNIGGPLWKFSGFIILISCLIVGVRFGGLGLAAVSGIGLTIFVFVIGLVPGKPPIDVMLTIMAVVTCSGFLQASKGLDVMLKYAEKLLREDPKQVTVLAPLTTWFLTVLCGTGHVVYTIVPNYL